MFVDHIKVFAQAGDGGDGAVSFRRESFVPRGGPDGGDGGRGGSIILRADVHVDNLTAFFYEPIIKAKNGERGRGKQSYGKAAMDKIVPVPVGTLVYRLPEERREPGLEPSVLYGTSSTYVDLSKSPEDEPAVEEEEMPGSEALAARRGKAPPIDPSKLELVKDLTEPGEEYVLCKGGKGGIGNTHFKSSRNRTPTQFKPGEPGENGYFYLELRKIADGGLVGYPNAGKSTLLTRLSAAKPKVAAYPFTTLTPHIGVVEMPEYRRFTIADIPGLIEGAHLNAGLGHDFLRHIVRCKLLIFVIDMAGSEGRPPIEDLQKLRRELDLYDPTLSERPWLVVANKMDLPEAAENLRHFRERFAKTEVVEVAAQSGEGIELLKERLARRVMAAHSPTEIPDAV